MLISLALRAFRRVLDRPTVRYSPAFNEFQRRIRYAPQEELLQSVMEYVAASQLDGDYLEFGVYQGVSLVRAWHFAQMNRLLGMRFYGFDSFQGLPDIHGVDAGGFQHFRASEYAASPDAVRGFLAKSGVNLAAVTLVPGWYEETLTKNLQGELSVRRVAVAHVDCDLYESTVPVLRFLTDSVQSGTVLIFDDWFCFRGDPHRGEQRAFREWLSAHPDITATPFLPLSWHGTSFLLQRALAG